MLTTVEKARCWLWAWGSVTLSLFKASWVLSNFSQGAHYISFSVFSVQPFTSFEHLLEDQVMVLNVYSSNIEVLHQGKMLFDS